MARNRDCRNRFSWLKCFIIIFIIFFIIATTVITFAIWGYKSDELTKWSSCSRDIELSDIATPAQLNMISIKHFPPVVVNWDRVVFVFVITNAKIANANKEINAYMYIVQDIENQKTWARCNIMIPAGISIQKFKINLGTGSLAQIYNGRIYIAASDAEIVADSKYDSFKVRSVSDYVSLAGILATVTTIIIALLSLWAQLTARLVRRDSVNSKMGETLKLYWSYMAILVALLGLIAFLSQLSAFQVTPNFFPVYLVGLGLFISSIFMIVLGILEPLVSVGFRVFPKGKTAFDPLFTSVEKDSKKINFEPAAYKNIFKGIVIFGIALTVLSILLTVSGVSWTYVVLIFACIGISAAVLYCCLIRHYLR